MKRNSLTLRLVLSAAALVTLSLVATDQLLVFMFRDHIEQRFDRALGDHMEELIAASEIDDAGRLTLAWTPFDPRFSRPGSGWYWRIGRKGAVAANSLSVEGMSLDPSPADDAGVANFRGPAGEGLRALIRPISLPGVDGVFVYAVTGPVSDIDGDVRRFSAITATTLSVLGLGLILAVIVQIRFGLHPLVDLRRALAEVRTGRADRMPETFPGEVEPVVDELNAVLDHNTGLLERARTQAGNLAHALKHPLTVMTNEIKQVEGERGRILAEEIAAMRGVVERHLSRARAAGPGGGAGARANVAEIAAGLRFSLDRLYRDRGLEIALDGMDGLVFAGDSRDCEEMLGNLMDNACKWAHSRVRVCGEMRDGRLRIMIEDDGPGIPEEARAAVLVRGRRLDESVPGAGLGLDIARDIAELYRGTLSLFTADLGGLKATLDLPAAPG